MPLKTLPLRVATDPAADLAHATAVIRCANGWSVAYLFGSHGKREADRIVRAVNAHAALVSALREMLGCAEFGSYPDADAIARVEAALKLAEGK